MSDDFLSRWSRRKREARRGQDAPAPAAEPAEPTLAPPETGEPDLTAEQVEALPPIDELTPDSDFAQFLQRGVPETLKKAALRRMWALDPAIRDYVGDARDYAYDWNVPGGVPGNGPLLPTDDVAEVLRRMFGDEPGVPEAGEARVTASDPVRRGETSQRDPSESAAGSDHPPASVAASEEEPADPEIPALTKSTEIPGFEAPREEAGEALPLSSDAPSGSEERSKPTSPSPPRRHGGAKPV